MATINPRARQLAQVSRAATQPARITQAARPTTSDPALNAWIGAMHEWRHVREGGGNPFEKVLTGRDLVEMGIATSTQITNPTTRPAPAAPGVVISTPNGQTVLGWEQFTESIRNSRLMRDLNRKIDDPTRFDELHARTKAALLEELAPIDGKIRGEIRRVEEIATSTKESLAQEVTTIRASVARASAGVRSVRAASASENRATAAQVTTVTARLDGFDGGAATVEEVMSAIADRTDGLEAKYTVKVTAGGAVAGFGLAATSNTAGASSAFIIQADKFAIVDSSYAGGLDTTPAADSIMFGVDGTGAYFKGDIRGGGNLNISGLARFEGNTSPDSIALSAAIVANDTAGRNYGVWAKGVVAGLAGTSLSAGGIGVEGSSTSGTGVGVRAVNLFGGTALKVEGPMTVTSTTKVTSLNADRVDDYHAGNSSGQIPVSNGTVNTNLNADMVDGYHSTDLCRVVNGNTGTATAAGSGYTMQMGTGLAPTYEVNCSGNNIILQTASDERLKQDIAQETWGLDFVLELAARAKQFRFRSDPSRLQHGWVAQDVEALIGSDATDALVFTNPNGMKGVNHLMAIAPMTRAIAALHARLTAIGA